jgi:hypothetical protein
LGKNWDSNGYAEVELNGNEQALRVYENLNQSPLESKIVIKGSNGETEFDENSASDSNTSSSLARNLKRSLDSIVSANNKSVLEIIEERLKQDCAK